MNKSKSGIFDVGELDLPDFTKGSTTSKEEAKIKVIKHELERLNTVIDKKTKEISELKNKVEKTKEDFHKKGFSEGYEKAKEDLTENFEVEFNNKIKGFSERFETTINQLQSSKSSIILSSEESIIKLIFRIIEKVIHHEISMDKSIVVDVVKNALPAIDTATKIEIIAHPDDVITLKEFENIWMAITMKRESISYIEKESIEPGGLIIVTNLGTVDVQLKTVLSNLENSILSHQKTVKVSDTI